MRGHIYMKKKRFCLCLAAAAMFGLYGCSSQSEPPVTIAVVTDGGNVDDLAINQTIWQAVQSYGDASGENTGYYIPSGDGSAACSEAIDEAVEKGAEVVICYGDAAGTAVYEAQREYRSVRFLVFDAEPHAEGSEKVRMRGNTRCILFDREQAGFLAGYAAAKEGYTSLAYYGGAEEDRAKEYGAGFLEGLQQAAAEMGLADGSIQVQYEERGTDAVSPDFMNAVEQEYQDGCQAIFTDGGGFEPIIRRSAEIVGGKILGVVTDESQKSTTVVISAENKYEEILNQELEKIAEDDFDGGKIKILGVKEGGVGLTTDTSQMQNFSEEQYQQITERIQKGEVSFPGAQILENIDDLNCLQIYTAE